MTSPRRWIPGLLALLVLAGLVVVRLTVDPNPQLGPAPMPAPTGTPAPAPGVVVGLPQPSGQLSDDQRHGLAFEEVTDEVGLATTAKATPTKGAMQGMTSGIAMGRLDGQEVLLLTSPADPVRLMRVDGGRFTDITEAAGLAKVGPATAAGFADLDGDGEDELVLGRQVDRTLSLYRAERGAFHDVTESSGVIGGIETRVDRRNVKPAIRGLAFADVDRDGRLDFLALDWNPAMAWALPQEQAGDPDEGSCRSARTLRGYPPTGITQSRLWLNAGEGRFRDATKEWGLRLDPVFAFTPQFVDLDEDGWLDLLLAGDICSSRIYRNDAGRGFVDITERTRPTMTPNGMGSVVRDFNGDGRADWFVTGIAYPTGAEPCPFLTVIAGCSGNRLFLGRGDGTFTDGTEESGLRDAAWAWGVQAADFGNTGDLQVAVTNGFLGGGVDRTSQWGVYYDRFDDDRMSFFVRDGERFVDVAEQVGLTDRGVGHALLARDFDGDGLLDLLVNDADTGPHLYRNVTPAQGRHWLTVRLQQPSYGARVRVTDAGGRQHHGWMGSNDSYETNAPPELHVGLGSSDGAVRIEVWWPGETTAEVFDGLRPDRVVTLRR